MRPKYNLKFKKKFFLCKNKLCIQLVLFTWVEHLREQDTVSQQKLQMMYQFLETRSRINSSSTLQFINAFTLGFPLLGTNWNAERYYLSLLWIFTSWRSSVVLMKVILKSASFHALRCWSKCCFQLLLSWKQTIFSWKKRMYIRCNFSTQILLYYCLSYNSFKNIMTV